jgi:hypothetical protein
MFAPYSPFSVVFIVITTRADLRMHRAPEQPPDLSSRQRHGCMRCGKTLPLPSAMPPLEMYGMLNSCAARAS